MNVLLQRLWIQITADRRRFTVLCAMVAVGLLLWGRVILISKVPRTAMADDEAVATAVAPGVATGGAKAAPGRSPATSKAATSASAKGSKASGAVASAGKSDPPEPPRPAGPPVAIALDRAAKHDPFWINPTFFPRPNDGEPIAQVPDKSWAQTSEDPEETARRQLARLQALADRLQLEAVMQGTPMAIISRHTYQLNDLVPSEDEAVQFQLAEVRDRSVLLKFKGREFELRIATPRGGSR